ncbi:hypothetical protein TNCV_4631211 [Trichonephila clavipes]|nr:hypothetical protein TNCV_4631211 [Trichonephila clavipes]
MCVLIDIGLFNEFGCDSFINSPLSRRSNTRANGDRPSSFDSRPRTTLQLAPLSPYYHNNKGASSLHRFHVEWPNLQGRSSVASGLEQGHQLFCDSGVSE